MRLALILAVSWLAMPADAQSGQQSANAQLAPTPGQGPQLGLRSEQPMLLAEPVAMMIAAFDRDGDARVTRAEFDAGLRASFDSIDVEHKGTLGYIGFADWSFKWLGDREALPSPFEVDKDGDNRISYAELTDRFALYFERFDKNRDGVIDRSELLTFRPPTTGGPGGRQSGGRRGGRGSGE